MKRTPPPDTPTQIKHTKQGLRRSVRHRNVTLSLTEGLANWVRNASEDEGIPMSSFVERTLRNVRDGEQNPPRTILLERQASGQLVAVELRNEPVKP